MITEDYRIAMAETLDILNHTRVEDVKKISKKFMEYLKENASTTYKTNLDHSKNIKDMVLHDKTKVILAIIYKKFWCDEEQRKKFDEKLEENEIRYQKEMREKYNPNEIFLSESSNVIENKNMPKSVTENINLVEYKEEKWYHKLFNKILSIFKLN